MGYNNSAPGGLRSALNLEHAQTYMVLNINTVRDSFPSYSVIFVLPVCHFFVYFQENFADCTMHSYIVVKYKSPGYKVHMSLLFFSQSV